MRNSGCFARRNFLAANEYARHHGADRADGLYIGRMRVPRYVFKSKHKYKKFAIAQMTVSSRSCVLAARLSPYAQSHTKSAPMRVKESFGVIKSPKF